MRCDSLLKNFAATAFSLTLLTLSGPKDTYADSLCNILLTNLRPELFVKAALTHPDLSFLNPTFLPGKLNLEIGGSNNPVCENCLQVDIWGDPLTYVQNYSDEEPRREAISRKQAMEEVSRWFPHPSTRSAAHQHGIIADGRALPLPSHSVGFIVYKCVSWYGPVSHRIQPMLREAFRVLAPGGHILILNDGFKALRVRKSGFAFLSPAPAGSQRKEQWDFDQDNGHIGASRFDTHKFDTHQKVAQSLGFVISEKLIDGGTILVKPNDPAL